MVLLTPTRSFLKSTPRERLYGFLAASVFSIIYYFAPAYVVGTVILVARRGLTPTTTVLLVPVVVTSLLPARIVTKVGKAVLESYWFQQIPKYFRFEEYHELTEEEFARLAHETSPPTRFIFVSHPHGIFPFTATCAMISALGAPSDAGVPTNKYKHLVSEDVPTAVATALRRMPVLNFVTGWFGTIDAGAKEVSKRLQVGSVALYVGGLLELFLSRTDREVVVLARRKGFVKLALRHNAKLVPVYYFGNTTCLSALNSGPLAAISRKFGVSLTLFWGRWFLPLPRPVKLVYVRGRPIDLPHIPEPTKDDIDKWHRVYCAKLLELFDAYKSKNPDYAHKSLLME